MEVRARRVIETVVRPVVFLAYLEGQHFWVVVKHREGRPHNGGERDDACEEVEDWRDDVGVQYH